MTTATQNDVSLGAEIDHIQTLRHKRAEHERAAEVLGRQIEEASVSLLARMDEEAITQAVGGSARVQVDESVYPVKDWDEFWNYIHEHRYYHLLQRRAHTKGCEELFAAGVRIPGVEPYTKRSVKFSAK